jgi:hypothetical protein
MYNIERKASPQRTRETRGNAETLPDLTGLDKVHVGNRVQAKTCEVFIDTSNSKHRRTKETKDNAEKIKGLVHSLQFAQRMPTTN